MRLLSHLSDCMTHVNTVTTPYSPPVGLAYSPHLPTTQLATLPGYQQHQHPVHVAYPELLPAELLARTVLSPMTRQSPELSPSENRMCSPEHAHNQNVLVTPLSHSTPATGNGCKAERPRVMRPLAELNCNAPKGNHQRDGKGTDGVVKAEPPSRPFGNQVPLHLPLHVDVKQEPMWRPW